MNSHFFMKLALDAAWKYQGLTYPNPAVGCVVVDKNGQILAVEAHQKRGEAHAELRAVASALKRLNPQFEFPSNPSNLHAFIIKHHNNLLKDSSIYVTLEPCAHYGSTPPCSLLLASLHVKRVYIGIRDNTLDAKGGVEFLKSHQISIELGVMQNECEMLIAPFLAWQEGHFGFVKLAMSLNGVMSGGTITCAASREHMHGIRDKLTLLVIGGNTLREDNPLLDARLVDGKAPNVLIYSKEKNIPHDAKLLTVQDREVFIEPNLQRFYDTRFGMIEAGPKMFENLPEDIKWMLVYRSNRFKKGIAPNVQNDWKMAWQGQIDEDSLGWFYRE